MSTLRYRAPRRRDALRHGVLVLLAVLAGVALFDVAVERSPDSAVLHTGRGRFFLNLGQPTDAVSAYRRALEIKGDASDALFGLGMAYAELAERELAIEALERFLVVAADAPAHVVAAAQDTIARMRFPG